jgi:acyl-coenzyme A thioesterase PaaI-like protein
VRCNTKLNSIWSVSCSNRLIRTITWEGLLPRAVAYTTVALTTNFVGAISRDTGRVLCEAEVVHRGGTIATAEGRLRAESSGKLLAHGTRTCLIIATGGSRNPGSNGNGSTP